MTENRRCDGTKADGSPCGASSRLVGDDGFCDAYRPGGREEMAERGRRGGYVSPSPRKAPLDLPPLVNPEAAQAWAENLARGVADGAVSASKGNTLNRLLKTWLASHENAEADKAIKRARESEVFGPSRLGDDTE